MIWGIALALTQLLRCAHMLDIAPGDVLLPVADAIEQTIGYRPSHATCWRWTNKGVRGVRLKTVSLGSLRRTTMAAVVEFVAEQNRAPGESNAMSGGAKSAGATGACRGKGHGVPTASSSPARQSA